jgi:hypothetical protein
MSTQRPNQAAADLMPQRPFMQGNLIDLLLD